jgi:hypothetical protein
MQPNHKKLILAGAVAGLVGIIGLSLYLSSSKKGDHPAGSTQDEANQQNAHLDEGSDEQVASHEASDDASVSADSESEETLAEGAVGLTPDGDASKGDMKGAHVVQGQKPGSPDGSLSVSGTPAAPTLTPGFAQSPDAKLAEKKEEPGPTCFSLTFHHKQMRSHNDGEACTHHRNLITLQHKKFNRKSLCVRVNGTPVDFKSIKGKPDQLVIGPVAGPKAKITARYCLDKEECKENCVVPKDEFMDAIGGMEEMGGDTSVAQWDAGDPNSKDEDVSAKIDKEFESYFAESSELSLFRDWVKESEAPACGAKLASK